MEDRVFFNIWQNSFLPPPLFPSSSTSPLPPYRLRILPRSPGRSLSPSASYHRSTPSNTDSVSFHRVSSIEAGAFKGVINLSELDLSNNRLASIPIESLTDTPYLQQLKLNNNLFIKKVSASYIYLLGCYHSMPCRFGKAFFLFGSYGGIVLFELWFMLLASLDGYPSLN